MRPTLGTGREDRLRMRCERSGEKLKEGNEWIVDADLKDFFGSVEHEKLMTLVSSAGSRRSRAATDREMLKAGCSAEGKLLPTEQGTPQGGVISPLLSNILLTPFDREMRTQGVSTDPVR